MANSPNYLATKEDSRPWRSHQDTVANAADLASVDNANRLEGEAPVRSKVNGVEVTGTPTVKEGNSTTLTAVVVSGVQDLGVTWSSEDTSIATVNSSGSVTGVKAGTTDIVATSVENPQFTTAVTFEVTN